MKTNIVAAINIGAKLTLWIMTFLIVFLGVHSLLRDVFHMPSYTIGPFYLREILPLLVALLFMIKYCTVIGPYDKPV